MQYVSLFFYRLASCKGGKFRENLAISSANKKYLCIQLFKLFRKKMVNELFRGGWLMYANHIVQLKFVSWTKMSILSSAMILKGWYFCLQTMHYSYNTNVADAGRRQRTREAHNILPVCKTYFIPSVLGNSEWDFVTYFLFSLSQVSLCHISRNDIPVEVENSS